MYKKVRVNVIDTFSKVHKNHCNLRYWKDFKYFTWTVSGKLSPRKLPLGKFPTIKITPGKFSPGKFPLRKFPSGIFPPMILNNPHLHFYFFCFFIIITIVYRTKIVWESIIFTFCLIKSWSHDHSECTNISHN